MSRHVSFAVLAVLSALAAVESITPAAAAQDQVLPARPPMGLSRQLPVLQATPNAWPPRAALPPLAGSIPSTRSRAGWERGANQDRY